MELYSIEKRIICLTFSFILFIIGSTGNALIIWTIWRIKHLRTVQNMIVVFLAIFDLLICGYLLPFSMHILIWNQEPEKRICKFQAIITAFLFSCSILIILLIALSRYVKICHSQRYDRICSMRNVIAATVFLCLVAASFVSPLWFVDDLWLFERSMNSCVFNRYGNIVYSVILIVFVIVIPCASTSLCYVQIYRYVMKARNQMHKHWNNGLARQKMKYEETLTMTQFSVFIVYMFLYFPFGITAIGGQRSDYPDIFHTVAIYMCYSNSCFNCILYGVLNKNMRRSYRQALPCINRKYSVKVHPTSVSGKIQQRNVSQRQQSVNT
jgi:hypothetical protein